jgi:hypothetical protein
MDRLDSVAPELANALRSAAPATKRRAVLAACQVATSRAGLDGEEIYAALQALRRDGPVEESLCKQLGELAARLDDEYLRLDEAGDDALKPDVLRLFSKARAASALTFAVSGDPGQFHEAVYEAIAAVDDAANVVRPVTEALRA